MTELTEDAIRDYLRRKVDEQVRTEAWLVELLGEPAFREMTIRDLTAGALMACRDVDKLGFPRLADRNAKRWESAARAEIERARQPRKEEA